MPPTKEFLEEHFLVKDLPVSEVAKLCNLAVPTIRHYMIKFGIPTIGRNRNVPNVGFLEGQKFGLLTVLNREYREDVKSHQAFWKCKCECGKIKIASTKLLRRGAIKSCGCLTRLKGKDNPRFKGYEEIGSGYIDIVKRGAKTRNIQYDLSYEYLWNLFLKQERKCALSGVILNLVVNYRKDKKEHTASLDRIDSSIGYIQGNVQWVHKTINFMKQDYTQQEFIDWCGKVTENNNVTTSGFSSTN